MSTPVIFREFKVAMQGIPGNGQVFVKTRVGAGLANDTITFTQPLVDNAGVVQWSTNGEPISTATNNQDYPVIVEAGAGGAIVAWSDVRSGSMDIYAQRIGSDGVLSACTPPDITITNSSPILSANQIGASYQWLDCDDNYAPIVGDTNQDFTATANGNFAVIVSGYGCTDTSDCYLTASIEAAA